MIITVSGLLLVLLGLLALALQRFYSSIPAKELKRLARRGDPLAVMLYLPVAYGSSMRLLLWTVFALAFSAGVLLLANGLVMPLAFGAIGLSVAGMIVLQSIRLTVHSARVAVHAAPALKWLLGYLHRPLSFVVRGVGKIRTHQAHSGLYEKEDIVALLQQQKEQVDNRIPDRDLDLLQRAVQFDERQAADVLLPVAKVKMVRIDDHIGPVLLGELHESGQTSFLVYEDTPEHVVGTLFLRDAVAAREGGRVADLVHARLTYVHEDFTLRQVMQAFMQTGQFMVVVINSFEEAVGVITLESLLAEVVGETPADDQVAYEDRTTVAAFRPPTRTAPSHANRASAETISESENEPSSPEATEVVE